VHIAGVGKNYSASLFPLPLLAAQQIGARTGLRGTALGKKNRISSDKLRTPNVGVTQHYTRQ
jgi:hypothetical protein